MTGSEVIFDLPEKKNRLEELEAALAKEGFWDNPQESKPILKERSFLIHQIETFETLQQGLVDGEAFLELAEEEEDTDALKEAMDQLGSTEKSIKEFSLTLMLSGEDDQNDAIVSINAGAGGYRGTGLGSNALPNVSALGGTKRIQI